MAKSSTTIDKNIRKELPARGKGKKSLMLDAIRDVCVDEQSFLKQVVTIGLGGWTQPEQKEDEEPIEPVFQQPNPMLLNMVLNRIEPPLKSISPMVKFKFNKDLSPHKQALQVIDAMAKGELPPDTGLMIISSITSMLKIKEVTDIDERLKLMELKIESQEQT